MSSWTAPQTIQFLIGIASVLGFFLLARILFLSVIIEVEEQTAVLVTCFGKLIHTFREPGAKFFFQKWLPGYEVTPVSLQRDFRHYQDISINDRSGTSLLIDLWIEFRIADPAKALFAVEDWEAALKSLLIHSATSLLSSREFIDILCRRHAMSQELRAEVLEDTTRWGLEVEFAFVRKVSVRPEVSRLMFDAVGAKLEMAKAEIEEEGRLCISMLEAKTAAKVAELVSEARSQHMAAVGRAFVAMKKTPEVLKAYQSLHELNITAPERLVSFQGFEGDAIRAIDAAMVFDGMGAHAADARSAVMHEARVTNEVQSS